ncbi:Leucine-rich repeat protein kinase family protein [Rhynchospora pubera]|uniref:non-specific serine/threonine protein kinase n=1 Tax=Rhynchospora pubera TaxID=906938 RepID=A0AAV8FYI3_9POAL|nr:Leucine-rich repeat protein kinase family protein [Rhynchospora pubera]
MLGVISPYVVGLSVVRKIQGIELRFWETSTGFEDRLIADMRGKVSCRLLLLLLCVASLQVAYGVTNSQDASALKSLMSQWQNVPSSWKQSTDPCDAPWDGIQCTNGRVTHLLLPAMNIKGKLTDDVGLLTELQYLDISSNPELGGSLPASIGKLQKLMNLILQGCSFSGTIPSEIGNLRNLTFLALNSNKFSGSIPNTIGLLSNLYWLDLADNQLTGPIPISSGTTPGLDFLVNTRHFHFNKNQLSGTLNATLFSSNMNLIHMIFDSNNFSGPIPNTIGLMETLEILQLDNNQLSGDIPTNITNLRGLNVLNLANNQLTGLIPNLAPLTNLSSLDLSNNSFASSTAPTWMTTLNSLYTLAMENTQLTGQIPPKLFTLAQIQQVSLDSNRFNGTLDMGSNLGQNLEKVSIRNNSITDANITSSYNGSISLINNPLCQLAKYSNNLYCQNQQNQTPYTTSLARCGSTACPNNQMLSPRNCTCAYAFSGLIVFRAPSFKDISDTAMFQELESSLWSQLGLAPNSVYISDVAITGDKYIEANVALFPVSGLYFSASDVIRLGFDLNNQTYQAPAMFGPYYFIQYPYQFPGSGSSSSSISTAAIAGIAVGGCVVLIALALVAVYALKQRRKVKEAAVLANPFASWGSGGKDDGAAPQLKGAKYFTFEELKKCTGNFSENNEIGQGGYGKVYKGYLANGVAVAIKRAEQGSMQGAQEFKNEIELLSRVHHKNLVGLVGFCYEQGEQLLVYEYISNGTLRENLVGKGGMHLDWRKRLQIALGSARGLAYLHELAHPPIIHRDIKSTNILLDDSLTAKVADFGLSKLLADTQKGHVSTQVKGTLGYLDPEYYMTQQLSEKSDVYSFGVVMLELITARLPIEKGTYIVREIKTAIDQYDQEYYGLRDMMDPKILNQAKNIGLRKFVQLAVDCVQDSASNRPSMNEVVKEIEIILQNDDSTRTTSANYSNDFGNAANLPKHPYSDQDPIIRDISSNAYDSSGAYPYQAYIEPK